MTRTDGRKSDEMRGLEITAGVNPYAEGSAVCSFGQTKVLSTASLEEGVPPFLTNSGKGWVTAEYALMPRSTQTRTSRDHRKGGRAREISRLIGRSLRAAVNLADLDGYTIKIDCDVMVADGGTRTASISGAYVALAMAMAKLGKKPAHQIAAISIGKLDDGLITDLCYEEDSAAQVDLNLVITKGGQLIEVQAGAEAGLFSSKELASMVAMGEEAARLIFTAQDQALKGCR